MSIENDIKNIIREHVPNWDKNKEDKISSNSNLVKDLGMNSLDFIDFLVGIEREYKIKIPDKEREKINTIQDMANYVSKHYISE